MAIINSANNFKVTGRNPIDAKQKVDTFAKLVDSATWLVDGAHVAYNGMLVTVSIDSDLNKRGLYILIDPTVANNFSSVDVKEANWHKIATLDELDNLADKSTVQAIEARVQALEASGGSGSGSISLDSFDSAYFGTSGGKITLTNLLDKDSTTITTDNKQLATGGFVRSTLDKALVSANKIVATEKRYKVITDATPDFTNPPLFTAMDNYGTSYPTVVAGNWVWSATQITYEGGSTLVSYAVSYVGKDGTPGQNGLNGEPGKDGTNGITPEIGTNGNWFIGDTDTGVPARGPQGEQGQQGETGNTLIKSINGTEINSTTARVNLYAPVTIDDSESVFAKDADGSDIKLDSNLYISVYNPDADAPGDGDNMTHMMKLYKFVIDDGILE